MTKIETRSTKRAIALFVSLAALGITAAHCGAPPGTGNSTGRPRGPSDFPPPVGPAGDAGTD